MTLLQLHEFKVLWWLLDMSVYGLEESLGRGDYSSRRLYVRASVLSFDVTAQEQHLITIEFCREVGDLS